MEYPTVLRDEYGSRYQLMQMYALCALGFLIPFTVGHPQAAVGVLVNALIIRAALSMPLRTAMPVIFAPTFGVLARGLLLGPFTPFVALMMPFIWVGNFVLLYGMSLKRNYAASLVGASVLKAAFLFGFAQLMLSGGLIPAILLPTMGVFQLWTALAGGILAYGELKAEGLLRK